MGKEENDDDRSRPGSSRRSQHLPLQSVHLQGLRLLRLFGPHLSEDAARLPFPFRSSSLIVGA